MWGQWPGRKDRESRFRAVKLTLSCVDEGNDRRTGKVLGNGEEDDWGSSWRPSRFLIRASSTTGYNGGQVIGGSLINIWFIVCWWTRRSKFLGKHVVHCVLRKDRSTWAREEKKSGKNLVFTVELFFKRGNRFPLIRCVAFAQDICRFNLLRWNDENPFSQNCNIFRVSSVFK